MHSNVHVNPPVTALPAGILTDMYEQLVQRVAKERDREAFAQLFQHFGPRIKAFMIKSGAEPALAEDLVQDVMMKVWQRAEQYRSDRGSTSTWIFTIARNARIDRLRRQSSQPYEDLDSVELATTDADAEEETFGNQRAQLVSGALAELPDDQREIIELAYLQDLPQSAIAERLDLPLGTVKSRMRLAYAKLRSQLEVLQ